MKDDCQATTPEPQGKLPIPCSRCGKDAVVRVGLADPDATQYPMCRKCADQWRMDLWLALGTNLQPLDVTGSNWQPDTMDTGLYTKAETDSAGESQPSMTVSEVSDKQKNSPHP